jgi:predicted nucleic acid-binding protein
MILVDTSVWVDHLRRGNERLKSILLDDQVLCHPFVVGELACGHLTKRREILSLLQALPQADEIRHTEALAFVDTHRLMGLGLGWIDVHLLASAVLARARLWTLDARLHKAAQAQRVAMG